MPIVVHYINEHMRPDIIEGESWRQIDQDSPRMGTINLKSLEDGHRIIVNKSAVAKVEEIPQVTWDANIEAQKKAQEEQENRQLLAEADKKARAAADGKALRAFRRVKDLRQVDIAKAANVDVGLISLIEHDLVRDTPGVIAAKTRILKALDMCPAETEQK